MFTKLINIVTVPCLLGSSPKRGMLCWINAPLAAGAGRRSEDDDKRPRIGGFHDMVDLAESGWRRFRQSCYGKRPASNGPHPAIRGSAPMGRCPSRQALDVRVCEAFQHVDRARVIRIDAFFKVKQ